MSKLIRRMPITCIWATTFIAVGIADKSVKFGLIGAGILAVAILVDQLT